MNVRIAEIHARHLGPLDKLDLKLGSVNLVWGRNEKGKTHLVEFIIRSLFQNARAWSPKRDSASGKVWVEGLDPHPVSFVPYKKPKIEDYWETRSSGLPVNFSRLLVVRAAELDIGGDTRDAVTPFLSDKTVFNQIGVRIAPTLRSASVSPSGIIGPDQGDIKKLRKCEQSLRRLDGLFDRIDAEYSTADRKRLETELSRTEIDIERQGSAKRHQAGKTAREIADLENRLAGLDAALLEKTRKAVVLHSTKRDELVQKSAVWRTSAERSRHYVWLQEAIREYRGRLDRVERPRSLWIVLALLAAAAALVLLFLGLRIPAAVVLLLAVICFAWDRKTLGAVLSHDAILEEKGKLESAFKSKFGTPLTGLPQMAELLNGMEADFHTARTLRTQIDDEASGQAALESEITRNLQTLCGEKASPDDWAERLRRIETERSEIDRDIRTLQSRIDRLNVNPDDYEPDSPGIEYSPSELDNLTRRAADLRNAMNQSDDALKILKQDITNAIEDLVTVSLDTAIDHLREYRDYEAHAYRGLTAEIISKIAVFSVLSDLAKDEDTQIEKGLASAEIAGPLSRITRRYERVQLRDGKLVVSDPYNDFPLDELSTGARDQVLLALRVGFAVRWMKKDGLFLVLDDAFQHADWERRERLVDLVMDLARSGWQILYLTMDDHIRDLFNEKGKAFGKDFVSIELS